MNQLNLFIAPVEEVSSINKSDRYILPDWNGTPDDSKRACTDWWRRLGITDRQRWKSRYEHLISIEDGTYTPGVYDANCPKGKRPGDSKPYPNKMGAQASLKQGLEWLTELMIELKDPNL